MTPTSGALAILVPNIASHSPLPIVEKNALLRSVSKGRQILWLLNSPAQSVQIADTPSFARLPNLTYSGRVAWLRARFDLVFLAPFNKFVGLDSECYVWLCVVNLLTTAVEALADFEFDGTGGGRFSKFVEKYFSPDFRKGVLKLDDPIKHIAVTPAEHLYQFFRCGLAHSFCIKGVDCCIVKTVQPTIYLSANLCLDKGPSESFRENWSKISCRR